MWMRQPDRSNRASLPLTLLHLWKGAAGSVPVSGSVASSCITSRSISLTPSSPRSSRALTAKDAHRHSAQPIQRQLRRILQKSLRTVSIEEVLRCNKWANKYKCAETNSFFTFQSDQVSRCFLPFIILHVRARDCLPPPFNSCFRRMIGWKRNTSNNWLL